MGKENQITEEQTNEITSTDNELEDCSFCIAVKDGVTSLKAEGTLGGLAEVFANAALQSEQLNELLKIVMFMLAEHELAQQAENDDSEGMPEMPEGVGEMLKSMFGNMGKA